MSGAIALLILVVAMFGLWPWILNRLLGIQQGIARRHADLAYRANEQHRQWVGGDDAGMYGQYPPADL